MKRVQRSCLSAIALGLMAAVNASAEPVLTFEWVGSGQTFAPTDSVEMKARVTNSGDMDLVEAVAFGGFDTFNGAPDVFNNYVESFPPGFGFGPDGPFSIGVGESVEFTFIIWDTWPITGDPGDPVPTGEYRVANAAILSLTYTTFNPFEQNQVDFSQAGDYVWTVSDTRPEPPVIPTPTAAMAGLVLLTWCGLRRRR